MNQIMEFPVFDVRYSDLNYFILELEAAYRSGKINSWGELEEKVNFFFTPEKMAQMEEGIPGWIKMASFSGGITLTHVLCVFLGMFLLPEFQKLTPEQQQLAKWIVLFHDVEIEPPAPRLAALTAMIFYSAVDMILRHPGLIYIAACHIHIFSIKPGLPAPSTMEVFQPH